SEPRGAARPIVLLWEIFVVRRWTPMRRRNPGWLTIFSDPLTRLSRPVSNVIGPGRFILENNDFPISRCGLDRVAHCKDAYSNGVIGPFHCFSISPTHQPILPVTGPQYALRRYRQSSSAALLSTCPIMERCESPAANTR